MKQIKLTTQSSLEQTTKYLMITDQFHKLKGQSLDLMALLITEYIRLTQLGVESDMAYQMIFSKEMKYRFRETLGIEAARFNNILSSLRKSKLINDNRIHSSLIPLVIDNQIKLLYVIDLADIKQL